MEASRRLELGQWFTPAPVADLALALALPRPLPNRARIIDPACGDGAFLARALARGVPAAALHGIDVDPAAVAGARARVPGATVTCADLFTAEADRFDAVVGNPPYVRQERLDAATKARLRARLRRDWPDEAEIVARLIGRGDLAAACVARALRMVRQGGRLALVVSSALLDADYAAPLWQLLARRARVLALIDAPEERWFDDAAVNTLILVLARDDAPEDAPVAVARLRVPTATAAATVRELADLPSVAAVRAGSARRPHELGPLLRAPDVWFEAASAAGEALVPLGELAEVRRGLTSGANRFFYLTRPRAADLGLEPSTLYPLVGAPPRGRPVAIELVPAETERLVFAPPADLRDLPRARAYVEAHRHLAAQPTLEARPQFWRLPVRPARLFLTKAYAARFLQRVAPSPVVADQRVYALHPRAAVKPEHLAAILNSTWTALALESLGRASMGEGALEWTVADARGLPVIDPRRLAADTRRVIEAAFTALCRRPIDDVRAERARDDRRRLDAAVAPALVDLLARVHEALVRSTDARAQRGRARPPHE